MTKTYTTLYADKVDGKPVKARGSITIATGKRKSIKVPVAQSEGWLNELIVKQIPVGSGGGTAIAFSVELMDSCVPYHDADNSLSEFEEAYNAASLIEPELFRVIDAIAVATPGDPAKLRVADMGYKYVNADQVSQTANEPFLYLCIIPTNSGGATKWQATLTTSKDIF